MVKILLSNKARDEKGQALILVLVLLLVGGLLIAPLLAYMSTGLRVGQVYEMKMEDLYAADAGVEDGLWQIKYDHLEEKFTSPAYDPYDYDEVYDYTDYLDVNDRDVDVTIENIWVPKGHEDIFPPSPSEARQLIEAGKLLIIGSVTGGTQEYQIKIDYYKDETDAPLEVEELGIWLPPGFNYDVDGQGEDDFEAYLEANLPGSAYSMEITDYASGKAVVWTFTPAVLFTDLPGVNPLDQPMESIITFQFKGPSGRSPEAVSWIITDEVNDIPYTWDADTRVYKITSEAYRDISEPPNTTVEAYTVKSEIRKLGSAMSGDYWAIGATLMTSTDDPYYRDRLYKESSATIDEGDIPPTATIDAAWLYWSGWIEETSGQVLFVDDSSNFSDWDNPGSDWGISSGRFRGHHRGSEAHRYLTMQSSLDLSDYQGETVELFWNQDESGWLESSDCLKFEFSADGGLTWDGLITAFCDDNPPSSFSYTIPDEYLTANFKMRFYLENFGGSYEYVYIDNIRISVVGSPVEDAKVNRVIFNDIPITADEWQVEPTADAGDQSGSTGGENSWSYSCFEDVTDLFQQWIEDEEIGSNGSGTYTVGHWLEDGTEVYQLHPAGTTGYPLATPATKTGWSYPTQYQWTYAGWSLLIIYSSPETKGHQLYLFDDFRYVGLNTILEFPVSGFLAPDDTEGSHLTYFVGEGDDHYVGDHIEINGNALSDPPDNPWNNIFNSYSNTIDDPILKSGIDIDTFDMSDYISPGDTSADVELDNGQEIYDLVYIILSFRSEITSGGTVTYLIRG